MERMGKTLKEMRKAGITVSIDYFSTGHSLFAHLRNLPIDILKIDNELIQSISVNEYDEAVISSMIDLAHKIDIEVTAECVETQKQLDFLREKGCNMVQGFLLGIPMPPDDFFEWATKKVA